MLITIRNTMYFILHVLCLFSVQVKCSNGDSEGIVMLKSKDSFLVGKRLSTIVENKPYAAFLRIPYAEPPIKGLRFKPPKKQEAWLENTTYDYSKPYNDTCANGLTEDCLYLSVFMPLIDNLITNHTVLVWIHEESNMYEPDFFIDEDVLVVTVSYRAAILGFLNTEDDFAEGNMGAKDVLMALKWVKDNIAVFNGDMNKVTVAGSGKAATVVASCLLSSAAEDLFNRVVIQSGSALSPADFTGYNAKTLRKLYWKLSGNKDFDREKLYQMLNNATLKDLMKLSENLFDSTEVRDRQRLINSFGPTVETHNKNPFLNKLPIDVYKRKMGNNVDVMIGYTNLESIYKLKGFVKNKKLLKYLNYNFQYLLPFEGRPDEFGSERYGKIGEKIMRFYFANGTIGERSFRRYAKYGSDQVIYPLVRQARLQAATSCNPVYLYRFSFCGLLNVGWESVGLNYSGATAGDEICYLFKCKSVNDIYRSAEASNERQFIKKIARLWANFAKCGNPTPETSDDILGDLKWDPLHRSGKIKGMNLGKKLKMMVLPEEKRIRFWDQLKEEFFQDKQVIGREEL